MIRFNVAPSSMTGNGVSWDSFDFGDLRPDLRARGRERRETPAKTRVGVPHETIFTNISRTWPVASTHWGLAITWPLAEPLWGTLYHHRASLRRVVSSPNRRDRGARASLFGADIDEENLIVIMVDDTAQSSAQLDKRPMRELAAKDGQLHVFPVALHQLEHLAQSLGIADVV